MKFGDSTTTSLPFVRFCQGDMALGSVHLGSGHET